ncbi:hypothetical protein OO17_15095 [Rhodopseudomonas palustris]|uniref:Uncharacterized protein n=1 Tax=Rhodopseudomonas palustris TaxID=1076 RepID=A0A0D7EKR9_RHOPL|nr:hypothetical protein OO17_15095 [Rhodopseudomonas palustris]
MLNWTNAKLLPSLYRIGEASVFVVARTSWLTKVPDVQRVIAAGLAAIASDLLAETAGNDWIIAEDGSAVHSSLEAQIWCRPNR